MSWVVHCRAIRQRSKRQQAHIQPYVGVDLWQRLRGILNAETAIPLSGVSLDGDRFDIPKDWAMQFDIEMPHPLEIQACARQSAAIPIAGERVAVKTSA